MRRAVVLLVASSLAAHATSAQRFVGTPQLRVTAGPEALARDRLKPEEAEEERLVLEKRGDQWVWRSRDGQPVDHTEGAAYHYFEGSGGGYVKIERATGIYLEHMSVGMASITYWGVVAGFTP